MTQVLFREGVIFVVTAYDAKGLFIAVFPVLNFASLVSPYICEEVLD